MIIALIIVFIILKYPPAGLKVSQFLRSINGQSPKLANSSEIAWIGYSYFAFRLMHVLREWQQGRYFNASLRDFVVYVLFFPTFTAAQSLGWTISKNNWNNAMLSRLRKISWKGGGALSMALFYKFILADSLALLTLNPLSAQQVRSTGWMWVVGLCLCFPFVF